MIFGNVELHNIDEAHKDEIGWQLQRVPNRLREHLNPGAQMRVLSPANSEIRFAMLDDEPVRITLSSVSATTQVAPYFGEFRHGPVLEIGQTPETITLELPQRLLASLDDLPGERAFSPRVVRLMLWGGQVRFHEVTGNVAPPTAEQLPKRRYLAYGTSITHGSAASAPHLTYVAQTAWRLGVDLLNLGVGGSCYCEKEFADYIAEREDWDFATLALSVNMVGSFSRETFKERVDYLVNTVAGADTSRPVVCITLYPHFRDLGVMDLDLKAKTADFRQILTDVVEACPHPNVHLAPGPEILRSYAGLTTDMLHPSDLGMIAMGEELAGFLKPLIG